MPTSTNRLIARNIAVVLLAGVWKQAPMANRLLTLLGPRNRKNHQALVVELLRAHKGAYPPSLKETARLVAGLTSFEPIAAQILRRKEPLRIALKAPRFAPCTILQDVDVPPLPTAGDIADWLGLSITELDWFTDERRQHRRAAAPEFQHYTYAFRAKSVGPPRLIESPKPRLKTIQRRILRTILDRVPTHNAAHGFVKGKSCRTGAEAHAGAAIVVCFDIADFFLSTPLGRVHALFRTLGYPDIAARTLTRLCSTTTPNAVLDRIPNARRHTRAALRAYGEPHLPQGAPTSPALANLVAHRLDVRLSGLAASLGGRFSRYADDLTFSGDGDFAQRSNSLVQAVTDIVEDEGYALNERKTRVMSGSKRQQVTGIVVNAHLNAPRACFDQLKAILHNCRLRGLDAENRDKHPDFRAHLEGRIGWVESLNPKRGQKLRRMLQAIS